MKKEEKEDYNEDKLYYKNSVLLHNSPILTINVTHKERIKILKQKKNPSLFQYHLYNHF
jgi:hypothetical protein